MAINHLLQERARCEAALAFSDQIFHFTHDRLEAETIDQTISHEEAVAIIDEVLEFLRGGLDRLTAQ